MRPSRGFDDQTLSHIYEPPEPELHGSIRLPEVELPPRPGLRRRVRFHALVLWGYVHVVGMLLLLVAGLAVLGPIWFLLGIVPLLAAVLPALRLELPPPDGLKLTSANAPDLLELVERHRRRLKAPRLSGVVLVSEANAFVYEVPRLGVLGWNRIYLGIGLPYLLALGPEELEGVVVHELAHVARRHVASAAGLRSSLERWQQLNERLDERGTGRAASSARSSAATSRAWSARRSRSAAGTSTKPTGLQPRLSARPRQPASSGSRWSTATSTSRSGTRCSGSPTTAPRRPHPTPACDPRLARRSRRRVHVRRSSSASSSRTGRIRPSRSGYGPWASTGSSLRA